MAVATDDFNRADAATLGANWTVSKSGMQIISNQVEPVNFGTALQCCTRNDITPGDDQYSQVTIKPSLATIGGYSSMLVVRHGGSGATQRGYIAYWGDAWATLHMGVIINDSIDASNDTGVATADNDVIRLEVEGNFVRVFKNSVQAGSDWERTTYASGNVGFGGDFTGYDVMDNWEGGDLAGPSPRRFFLKH